MHKNQKVQRTVEIAEARFADSVVDVPVDMTASFYKVQKTAVARREENRCRSEDSRGPTVSDREELGESVDVAKTAQHPQLLAVKKIVETPDVHTVHDEPDTRSPDAEAVNTLEGDRAAQSGERRPECLGGGKKETDRSQEKQPEQGQQTEHLGRGGQPEQRQQDGQEERGKQCGMRREK